MESFFQSFLTLYESTGINITILYDAFDRARFVDGIQTTIWLSISCLFFSLVIGLVGAWLIPFVVILSPLLTMQLLQAWSGDLEIVQRWPGPARTATYLVVLVLILFLGVDGGPTFFYFQF